MENNIFKQKHGYGKRNAFCNSGALIVAQLFNGNKVKSLQNNK